MPLHMPEHAHWYVGALLCACCLLSACGVVLQSEHVHRDKLGQELATKPGIYYALPGTEIDIRAPVAFKHVTRGRWAHFDACDAQCSSGTSGNCSRQQPAADEPVLTWKTPEISTFSVPDLNHVYRVEPGHTIPFMTVNHELTLSRGVLSGAKLSGTNQTAAAVVSVLGAAQPILGLLSGVPAVPKEQKDLSGAASQARLSAQQKKNPEDTQSAQAPSAVACNQAEAELASTRRTQLQGTRDLARRQALASLLGKQHAKTDSLSCAVVRCVADTLIELRTQAGQELDDADRFLKSTPPPLAAMATVRLDHARQRSQQLLAQADAIRADWKMASLAVEGQAVASLTQRLAPKRAAAQAIDSRLLKGEALRVEMADTSPEVQAAVTTAIQKQGMTVTVTATADGAVAPANSASAPASGGYRYRLPADGRIEVKQGAQMLATKVEGIAQFGAIAALPSHFSGMSATLNFALDAQGALQSVTLGQKAQDLAPMTALATQAKARETEAAGAELKSAKAQTDLTAEAIKSEKQARCLDALKTQPASVPDFCK